MVSTLKVRLIGFCTALILLSSCEVLEQILGKVQLPVLTKEEIVKGLKEALTLGVNKAVINLSKENGFYGDKLVQIGFPKEADVIVKNIAKVPLLGDKVLEETRKIINKAAEDAAIEAGPIFKNVITSMSIADAVGILKGNDSAATNYLRIKTYRQLKQAFMPKIQASLGKKLIQDVSAENAYKSLIDKYNTAAKIPFSGLEQVKTNSLSQYVTRRALNGLFLKVAGEEKLIRDNPSARVSEILKKVFDENNRNSALTY